MKVFETLHIDQETYQAIRLLAKAGQRTIVGQVRFMVEMWGKAYRVVNISPLPGPDDAGTLPLVEIVPMESSHEAS